MTATSAPSTSTASPHRTSATRRRRGVAARQERLAGYVFLSPWLIGLMGITAIPTLYSLYLSFTNFELFTPGKWVGLANYRQMFTNDPTYLHSITVTLTYSLVAVPLKLTAALVVAMLLVRERRGIGLFRGLFYLPSLLGGSVALAFVWHTVFSRGGALNGALALVGIQGRPWVDDPSTALGTLILLAVWQFGAPMVIFLAGLKQIPTELYEAASVDGAGRWRSFRSVTVPMLSPVIFFNLVLEVIHAFQAFTPAFIVSGGTGGPANSTLLYTLNLYIQAFANGKMAYASAMAWILLAAAALLTSLLFSTSRFWVHYSDGGRS